MNKLWLIIKREYLTRVKKKGFILLTLLSPLIFVGLFTLPALLVVFTEDEQKNVAVKDDSGIFVNNIKSTGDVSFTLRREPLDDLKASYRSEGFDGVLYIPKFDDLNRDLGITYFSQGQLSLSTVQFIEDEIAERIEEYKVKTSGYDEKVLNSFKTNVLLEQRELGYNEEGELVEMNKKNSAGIATAIGYISGFIIYIILILYGSMVMRSVMEEKTSRIVEVIISSVKPFQLMMGKIIGVSAVGLTQLVVWIVLTIVLMTVAGAFIPIDPSALQPNLGPMQQPPEEVVSQAAETLSLIKDQNWSYILPVFLFYFIGGYFIYSSLFAAVGSAMGDDMGESQSLTIVAMFPIIISIIMITPVVENPTSTVAVWFSIIPLFSPVIMPARIAFEPPLWEVILSMVVLAASAVFFIWLSGRIYRVGILMYGKKATWKEMGRWMFYRE